MNNFYTKGEDIANAITHGIGTLLAITGLVLLIVFSSLYKTPWHIVSYAIFGSTLVIMYAGSTLYHSFTNERVKYVFRILDHSAIYLLIAGTYTPFCLTILRGPIGWTLFGVVWGFAVVGIVIKSIWLEKFDKISTAIYVLMGWLIVLAIKNIILAMPMTGFILLVAGGVSYTVGCYFYIKSRMPYGHAVWHLFVLGGSICHLLSVLLYIP